MVASRPHLGVRHVTVVPTNYDPDDSDGSDREWTRTRPRSRDPTGPSNRDGDAA